MRFDNVQVIEETLSVLNNGSYTAQGKLVSLRLSLDDMCRVITYLPADVDKIRNNTTFNPKQSSSRCDINCYNESSFSAARRYGFIGKKSDLYTCRRL